MHIAWVTVSGWSRPTHQKQYKVNVFLLNIVFLVVDAAKSVAGMGRGAPRARTSGQPDAGPRVLPVKKQYKVIVFLLVNIDVLLVDAATCVAGVGRGAHRARTSGQPQAGPRVLPDKNPTKSMCVLPTLTFFLSTLRNAKEEWDAAHIAGGRLGNH